ncbi:DUF4252 domain-containing protein [Lacinutrix iliipiscaria]|uniref:DUF4252 domain-containing protein n=1 Tax=Lacinutrix iliipiscaria TaxID=1230532 RepID=A0ABW5WSB5_9FLAO
MIQSIKKSLFSLLALIMLVSCSNTQSLQTYFVDNQETPNFTTLDIPTSIVKFENTELSASELEAYESIDKLNFLGFKLDSNNLDSYKAEMNKVSSILSDKKYIDLGEFNMQGSKMIVKYLGDNDIADEFIIFGNSKDVGFGVLRVLGDDMSPAKLYMLAQSMNKASVDQSQLQSLTDFFK